MVSHKDSDYQYDDGIVNIFLYAGGKVNTSDTDYGNKLKEMLEYIVSGDKPTEPDDDIEKIRERLEKRLDLSEGVIDELFAEVDSEENTQ